MLGGARSGAGRRPARIDLIELEKLCSLQATDEELASFFGVSVRTVENRRKQPKYAEAMNRGRAKGRISVRRAQMKLLESGSASMGIWLGKQLLGQSDLQKVETTGRDGGPLTIVISKEDENL
jgi:hypothetical protein